MSGEKSGVSRRRLPNGSFVDGSKRALLARTDKLFDPPIAPLAQQELGLAGTGKHMVEAEVTPVSQRTASGAYHSRVLDPDSRLMKCPTDPDDPEFPTQLKPGEHFD